MYPVTKERRIWKARQRIPTADVDGLTPKVIITQLVAVGHWVTFALPKLGLCLGLCELGQSWTRETTGLGEGMLISFLFTHRLYTLGGLPMAICPIILAVAWNRYAATLHFPRFNCYHHMKFTIRKTWLQKSRLNVSDRWTRLLWKSIQDFFFFWI